MPKLQCGFVTLLQRRCRLTQYHFKSTQVVMLIFKPKRSENTVNWQAFAVCFSKIILFPIKFEVMSVLITNWLVSLHLHLPPAKKYETELVLTAQDNDKKNSKYQCVINLPHWSVLSRYPSQLLFPFYLAVTSSTIKDSFVVKSPLVQQLVTSSHQTSTQDHNIFIRSAKRSIRAVTLTPLSHLGLTIAFYFRKGGRPGELKKYLDRLVKPS